jgi:hypothetical protein
MVKIKRKIYRHKVQNIKIITAYHTHKGVSE